MSPGISLDAAARRRAQPRRPQREREFCIGNPLVRIHVIIVMIRWTGLAPWEFELPFPGSVTSTFRHPHLHAVRGLPANRFRAKREKLERV